MSALDIINNMTVPQFVASFASLFEHSPWVAEKAALLRPFISLDDMVVRMSGVVQDAGEEAQLRLVRAHPELARRAGVDPTLTLASQHEQASAGLDRLTPTEYAHFNALNDAYLAKFEMPFVICVRLSDKAHILSEMARRTALAPADELRTALEQISKIAALRLKDAAKALEGSEHG